MTLQDLVMRGRMRLAGAVLGKSLPRAEAAPKDRGEAELEILIERLGAEAAMQPVVAAARLLRSEKAPVPLVAAALTAPGGWIGKLLKLELEGTKYGLWRHLWDESPASRVVRKVVTKQGRGRLEAYTLARLVDSTGSMVVVEEVLDELEGWARAVDILDDAGRTAARPAPIVPPVLAPVEPPPTATVVDPAIAPEEPAEPEPVRSSEPDIVDEILLINVNQHLGSDIGGWYQGEERGELLLILRTKMPGALKAKLEAAGLLLEELGGARRGPLGTILIKAAKRDYDVFVIDTGKLRTLVGDSSYGRIPRTFDSRWNPAARSYPLRIVSRLSTCPRCQSKLEGVDGRNGAYYRCPQKETCGFTVKLQEDRTPMAPQVCGACGHKTYMDRTGEWAHLAPCAVAGQAVAA